MGFYKCLGKEFKRRINVCGFFVVLNVFDDWGMIFDNINKIFK